MMINTRILKAEFEYLTPNTLKEALDQLDKYGPDAKVIAGGTDLLVQMKQETIFPKYLLNITNIAEINFIREEDEWLRIGAATKWREIMEYCSKDSSYAAIYESSHSLGKVQVRNMGTIGGNLCTASPAADSAPSLLVLNGRVKLANKKKERILKLEDFFKFVNLTALLPDEIMVEIQIPKIQKRRGSAFNKLTRVGADISKISCAVAVEQENNICTSCRISMGAVAPVPLVIKSAPEIVMNKEVSPSLIEEMGKKVAQEIKPITDIRSTEEYRREVASVLMRDTFWKAWHRAGGKGWNTEK